MTSFKNKLQELFQKKSLPVPEYKTEIQDNSTPHMPIWQSKCQVEYEGKVYKASHTDTSKIGVELKVAETIYKNIMAKKGKNIEKSSTVAKEQIVTIKKTDKKTNTQTNEKETTFAKSDSKKKSILNKKTPMYHIFVDLDSVDLPVKCVQETKHEFFIFMSKNGTKDKQLEQLKQFDNVEVLIPESAGIPDITDHLISCTIGEHRAIARLKKQKLNILVVTKDHFGAGIAIICQGTHVCNIPDLEKLLF